jgi:hypothetical protein
MRNWRIELMNRLAKSRKSTARSLGGLGAPLRKLTDSSEEPRSEWLTGRFISVHQACRLPRSSPKAPALNRTLWGFPCTNKNHQRVNPDRELVNIFTAPRTASLPA